MIKNIIFDWSGVINDNVETVYQVVLEIFEKFDGPHISLGEFKREWEQPYMRFYNKYLPDLTHEQESRAYEEAIKKHPDVTTPKGMRKLLKDLKQAGVGLYVVSSDYEFTLQKDLGEFDLEGVFSDTMSEVYDKLEAVKDIVSIHGLEPNETMFVGDSNHEIEVANQLGLISAGVTWGFSTKENLEKHHPNYLFDDVSQMRKTLHQLGAFSTQ